MDAFEALGLPPRFDLSPAEVEQAYLSAVGGVHPDIGGGAPMGSGSSDAASINDARRVLIDPERRAEALLARLGGPAKEDRSLPDGFLMEVMELRQQIEADLAADGAAARTRWEAWAAERRQERIASVGALFAGLSDPPRQEELAQIRVELNAWRYLERLIEQLDPEYDPAASDFE